MVPDGTILPYSPLLCTGKNWSTIKDKEPVGAFHVLKDILYEYKGEPNMKKWIALALALVLSLSPALALTPQELGELLKNEYAGEVPARVWEEDTVEGMLSALGDPFARYYTAQRYAAFLNEAVDGVGAGENRFELQGSVGRIKLDHFGQVDELAAWVEENDAAVNRWIVDLRSNRGGEMTAAADAMSLFAGGGHLLYLRDKDGALYGASNKNVTYTTMKPAIVLVGDTTASAAELFAATLRDRQKGLLIGSRTYGKGAAQSAFDQNHPTYGGMFADGSALLLTTSLVFSDAMVTNNIIGVLPHLVVEDDLAEPVARLLCADAPRGNTAGYARLHLARWRWYVDLQKADDLALRALLEALPPQAELYLGTGGADGWQETTPAQVAGSRDLWSYCPRTFSDVAGSPYADAINALKTYDIVKGDEKGDYNPTSGLTRASLCALLAQAMDYPMSKAAPAFPDTPADAWYTPYVTTLSALGIVNGYDDGLFHPDDPIPHQQFMTILARIMASTSHVTHGALEAGPDEAALATGDYAAYDPWAVPGAWLLDGSWHKEAKDIDPRAVTTREEAAYDLWSALSTLGLLPG